MNDELDQLMISRFKSLGKISYIVLAPLAFGLLLTLIPDADAVTASVLIQVFLILLAIPASLYRVIRRERFEPIVSSASLSVLGAGCLALPGLIVALGWVSEVFDVRSSNTVDPNVVLALLAVSVLVAPVAEEMFFRGVPSIIKSRGSQAAVAAVYGLLFVLVHVNISNMPAAILLSLLGCVAVIRSVPVVVMVLVHMIVNVSVVVFGQTIELLSPLSQPIWVQAAYVVVMLVSLGASVALAVGLFPAGRPAGLGSGGTPEPQRDKVKEKDS